MSWASGRRFAILLIVGAVVIAFLGILSISVLYKAPSCSDGVVNQGEAGVDCGGPCAYRCTAQEQPPTVLFTKAVPNGEGRIDAAAQVENKNPDAAAKNVLYKIMFYDTDQVLVNEVTGTLDLPPNTIVPVFVPGVSFGNRAVAGAFLDIDSSSFRWFAMPVDMHIVPVVSTPKLGGTPSAPRIEAVLTNTSVTPLTNVRAVVFVHNSAGAVIAASATVLPLIPAQGEASAVFTWNGAFPDMPVLIKVIPIIPLP